MGVKLKSRLFAQLMTWCMLAAASLLTGCATAYLDRGTPEVSASEFQKSSNPQAVQLAFDFQTKGAPNARATAMLKEQVVAQVKASGLFSAVSEEAQPGASLLSITLNNVPVTSQSDAVSKGFVTGLTFGLAGSQVTDGYICTVKYLPSNGKAPITKTAQHAIHATIGNAAAPQNADKMDSFLIAVQTMTKQVVSHVLNDLSRDPDFN